MQRVTIIAIPLAVLAASCGGSGVVYSENASYSCMKAKGYKASETDADYIAKGAGQGGFAVALDHNAANVAVDRNTHDAANTAKAYSAFEVVAGGGEIERKGNVTIAWDNTPTADERSAIVDCLKR
jgi:hypothetical protein